MSKKNKIESSYDVTESVKKKKEREHEVSETKLYNSCTPTLNTQFALLLFAQFSRSERKKVYAKKNF